MPFRENGAANALRLAPSAARTRLLACGRTTICDLHWALGTVGEDIVRRFGLRPVGWRAGFNAVVAMELLAEGAWHGTGVHTAESFDPDPYLAILDRDGIYYSTVEIEPGHAFA